MSDVSIRMTADDDAGITIETIALSDGWSGVLDDAGISATARAVSAITGTSGIVSLALCDDATLRDLNRRFRGNDVPTNVLSFPSADEGDFLGDIAIALETVIREASGQGKSAANHAAHMLVHGILHLLDHDHEDDESAARMENLERDILAELGISDPYGE